MSIANALSGGKSEEAPTSSSVSAPVPPPEPADEGSLSSLLKGMDPSLLGKLMTLYRSYQQGDDEKAALLTSIRPFLQAERAQRIDRAIQATRLTRVLRLAMDLFRKEDGGV